MSEVFKNEPFSPDLAMLLNQQIIVDRPGYLVGVSSQYASIIIHERRNIQSPVAYPLDPYISRTYRSVNEEEGFNRAYALHEEVTKHVANDALPELHAQALFDVANVFMEREPLRTSVGFQNGTDFISPPVQRALEATRDYMPRRRGHKKSRQ